MLSLDAPPRPPVPGRRPSARRLAAVLLALTGVGLTVGVPVAWWASRPAADLGAPVDVDPTATVPPATSPASSVEPGPASIPMASAGPSPDGAPPAVRTRDAAPTRPARTDVPVRLLLPARGLDAAVVPVGVARDGTMQLPTDVDRVGWYRFGPSAGDGAGAVVLAGHVDDAEQGLGALARLAGTRPGDRVEVVLASGRRVAYVVTGRQQLPKQRVPLDRLFTRDGAPHLVLVTCGGPFDARARHYRDNLVVRAESAR